MKLKYIKALNSGIFVLCTADLAGTPSISGYQVKKATGNWAAGYPTNLLSGATLDIISLHLEFM